MRYAASVLVSRNKTVFHVLKQDCAIIQSETRIVAVNVQLETLGIDPVVETSVQRTPTCFRLILVHQGQFLKH